MGWSDTGISIETIPKKNEQDSPSKTSQSFSQTNKKGNLQQPNKLDRQCELVLEQ